jgi:Icc-related predicted phosphoesterase
MPSSINLLLASDLHGSNACFRTLLRLASHLDISALIVAGDWSGKQAVLVSKNSDGSAEYKDAHDRRHMIKAEDVDATLRQLGEIGIYSVVVQDDHKPDQVEFTKLARAARARRLQQWLDYGRDQAANLRVMSIMGNDDGPEIDDVLSNHSWICSLDERREMFEGYEFFGLGYSTETPWHTPREISETEIASRLSKLTNKILDWSRTIAVIHVPPIDCEIDLAPEVDLNGNNIPQATGWDDLHVGSKAVRELIEQWHPMAVLSGHCHSARGVIHLGKTVCANAGSLYHVGILCAYLLRFDDKGRLTSYQFLMQ